MMLAAVRRRLSRNNGPRRIARWVQPQRGVHDDTGDRVGGLDRCGRAGRRPVRRVTDAGALRNAKRCGTRGTGPADRCHEHAHRQARRRIVRTNRQAVRAAFRAAQVTSAAPARSQRRGKRGGRFRSAGNRSRQATISGHWAIHLTGVRDVAAATDYPRGPGRGLPGAQSRRRPQTGALPAPHRRRRASPAPPPVPVPPANGVACRSRPPRGSNGIGNSGYMDTPVPGKSPAPREFRAAETPYATARSRGVFQGPPGPVRTVGSPVRASVYESRACTSRPSRATVTRNARRRWVGSGLLV